MITPQELVSREVYYCVSQLMCELREVVEQTEYAEEYRDLMYGISYDEAVEAWIEDLDAAELYDIAENVGYCSDMLQELALRPTTDKLAEFSEDALVFEQNDDEEWIWRGEVYPSAHNLIVNDVDAENYALAEWCDSTAALEYLDSDTLQHLRDKICEEIDDYQAFCNEHDVDTSDYEFEVYEHWIVSVWLARKLKERGHVVCDDFMGLTIWGRACTGQAIYMDSSIEGICNELNRD